MCPARAVLDSVVDPLSLLLLVPDFLFFLCFSLLSNRSGLRGVDLIELTAPPDNVVKEPDT